MCKQVRQKGRKEEPEAERQRERGRSQLSAQGSQARHGCFEFWLPGLFFKEATTSCTEQITPAGRLPIVEKNEGLPDQQKSCPPVVQTSQSVERALTPSPEETEA